MRVARGQRACTTHETLCCQAGSQGVAHPEWLPFLLWSALPSAGKGVMEVRGIQAAPCGWRSAR